MKKFILLLFCVSFLAGCATTAKPLYYWQDYSDSLYKYKKEPSDETFAAHKQTLQGIIELSGEKETRVPPGVFAELGLMYMKEGSAAEAVKFFRLEEETYPESAVLMSKMINGADKKTTQN